MTIKSFLFSLILFLGIVQSTILPQESEPSVFNFNYGLDIVSRYIWRGIDYSGSSFSPHLQPNASFSVDFKEKGALNVGFWGSVSLKNNYNETDLFLQYSVPVNFGSFTFGLTDYYFPYVKIPFTNFKNKGEGGHTLELSMLFSGPENFPVTFLASSNIYNDLSDQKSYYLEAGYSHSLLDFINLNYFIGSALGKSIWYNIESNHFEINNLGLSASKDMKLTENYSVPLSIIYVYNPYMKNSFLIGKLTFTGVKF